VEFVNKMGGKQASIEPKQYVPERGAKPTRQLNKPPMQS
jgi:hypothetical protein